MTPPGRRRHSPGSTWCPGRPDWRRGIDGSSPPVAPPARRRAWPRPGAGDRARMARRGAVRGPAGGHRGGAAGGRGRPGRPERLGPAAPRAARPWCALWWPTSRSTRGTGRGGAGPGLAWTDLVGPGAQRGGAGGGLRPSGRGAAWPTEPSPAHRDGPLVPRSRTAPVTSPPTWPGTHSPRPPAHRCSTRRRDAEMNHGGAGSPVLTSQRARPARPRGRPDPPPGWRARGVPARAPARLRRGHPARPGWPRWPGLAGPGGHDWTGRSADGEGGAVRPPK